MLCFPPLLFPFHWIHSHYSYAFLTPMLTLSLTSQHTFSKYPTPCNTPFVCLFSKLYLCFYCVSAFYIYFDVGCQDMHPQIKCTIIITIVVKILLVTFATAACCISRVETLCFVAFLLPADLQCDKWLHVSDCVHHSSHQNPIKWVLTQQQQQRMLKCISWRIPASDLHLHPAGAELHM